MSHEQRTESDVSTTRDDHDDTAGSAGSAGTNRPTNWEGRQTETDEGTAKPHAEEPNSALRPHWNKGEMAEERVDHTRAPLADGDDLGAPPDGLSGGGSNPGGGERWADRDKR